MINHSDRSLQCLAIKYTERLAESGIDPSVSSVENSYDNALAECHDWPVQNRSHPLPPSWKTVGQAEEKTLKWENWYNNGRLHSAIGYVTPQEAEEAFYANLNNLDKVA